MKFKIGELFDERLGYEDSEIDIRALGSAGFNFAAANTSSQRLHMDSSHLKSHLCLVDGDRKKLFTGIERNYAEEAHIVKFESGCMRVIDVITKYSGITPRDMDPPVKLIVYERQDDNSIDVVEMRSNHLQHPKFGFPLVKTEAGRKVDIDKAYEEGTILAKPPSITDDFDYKYGKEVNVFLGNCKAGIEDGAWISDELAYAMRSNAYGELEMSLNKKDIPLNVNGTLDKFKPIPDIGDYLRDDGLVMASREYHRDIPMALYNRKALMTHSQLDNLRYGEIPNEINFEIPYGQELLGRPRVIDIEVIKGGNNRAPITKVEEQLNKYWERTVMFYDQIRKCHEELERIIPGYELSPAWQRWVDSSYFYTNKPVGTRNEIFRRVNIPNWFVKITFAYVFIPTIGSKFANIHASKWVVVKKTPRKDMICDKDGTHADLIIEGMSTVNRMNAGVPMESRIGACERSARKKLKEMYESGVGVDECYAVYSDYVKTLSPMSSDIIDHESIDRKKALEEVIYKTGLEVYFPPSMGPLSIELINELSRKFPPCRDKLLIKNNLGVVEETDEPGEIGTMYIIILDRTGDSFAAVNSAKRQHHGIPTKASKTEKHSSPTKISSTRFPSETDSKSVQSHLNNEAIPELMDRTLNPVSHRILCRSLVRSEDPANIVDAVPRDIFPRKGNRVIAIRDGYLKVAGIRLKEGLDGNQVLPEDEE